jgi:hypothetical protein
MASLDGMPDAGNSALATKNLSPFEGHVIHQAASGFISWMPTWSLLHVRPCVTITLPADHEQASADII